MPKGKYRKYVIDKYTPIPRTTKFRHQTNMLRNETKDDATNLEVCFIKTLLVHNDIYFKTSHRFPLKILFNMLLKLMILNNLNILKIMLT